MPSEFTFRAQLISNEQRQIYDYWSRQAGKRVMPSSEDLDVNHIANLTHSLSLLKIRSDLTQSTFYSTGSHVQEVYGYCIKDMTLEDVISGDNEQYWRSVYANVVQRHAPRVGVIKDGVRSAVFWLRLPLTSNRTYVTDILCYEERHVLLQGRKDYHVASSEERALAL